MTPLSGDLRRGRVYTLTPSGRDTSAQSTASCQLHPGQQKCRARRRLSTSCACSTHVPFPRPISRRKCPRPPQFFAPSKKRSGRIRILPTTAIRCGASAERLRRPSSLRGPPRVLRLAGEASQSRARVTRLPSNCTPASHNVEKLSKGRSRKPARPRAPWLGRIWPSWNSNQSHPPPLPRAFRPR